MHWKVTRQKTKINSEITSFSDKMVEGTTYVPFYIYLQKFEINIPIFDDHNNNPEIRRPSLSQMLNESMPVKRRTKRTKTLTTFLSR
jgi:hypothetical protein